MQFLKFLSQFSHVETVIGLIAFIVAAVLGFLLYNNNDKLANLGKIIKSANTKTKAELARELLEVFPANKIPELTQEQGAEVLKMNLNHKAAEFKAKAKLITIGMVLLFLLVAGMIGKSYSDFKDVPPTKNAPNVSSTGDGSPIIIGNGNEVNQSSTAPDSSKKKK